MKNNNRLAVFVKEFQRLLHIYLNTPFGCEIAAERMAESTRKRVSPAISRVEPDIQSGLPVHRPYTPPR